jgi:monothiol glutaredoxin
MSAASTQGQLPEQVRQQITELVTTNEVVLFMKGNRHFPQCGFSAQVVQILNGHLSKYQTVNVLQDPAIRDGIKQFSSWPTIPQLYVKGEFVGGCDIIKEMQSSGELAKLLVDTAQAKGAAGAAGKTAASEVKAPAIKMTAEAVAALKKAQADDATGGGEPGVLRVEIDPQFSVDLFFGDKADGDFIVDASGIALHIDKDSATRADGLSIAYVQGPSGGAFRIDNPNEPARVKSLTVGEVKKLLDDKASFTFFDVRPENERARAKLDAAQPLDDAAYAKLESMDRKAMIVFHCHHGGRSRAAAEHFLKEGFTNVYNMDGGIDAWSETVDRAVPRY